MGGFKIGTPMETGSNAESTSRMESSIRESSSRRFLNSFDLRRRPFRIFIEGGVGGLRGPPVTCGRRVAEHCAVHSPAPHLHHRGGDTISISLRWKDHQIFETQLLLSAAIQLFQFLNYGAP